MTTHATGRSARRVQMSSSAIRDSINWHVDRTRTCQAALLATEIGLCRESAEFSYKGLWTPLDKIEYAWQTIRTELLLCEGHARKIITEFGWLIQDHKVEVRRLDIARYTVNCSACLSVSRIEIVGQAMVKLDEAYCPRCGTKGTLKQDAERDWMEAISERFDGMDLRLVEMLFHDWETSSKVPRFPDYVAQEVAKIYAGS